MILSNHIIPKMILQFHLIPHATQMKKLKDMKASIYTHLIYPRYWTQQHTVIPNEAPSTSITTAMNEIEELSFFFFSGPLVFTIFGTLQHLQGFGTM